MRKTKIVCTLGPASDNQDALRELIQSGMNVARINFSHGDYAEHERVINLVKKLRREMQVPIGIMLDTRGPEIRLGTFKNGQETLTPGGRFTLTARDVQGDATCVSINYKNLPADVHPGTQILLDDGLIELRVESIDGPDILCSVVDGGIIKNRKGVNLPGSTLSIPFISDKDRADIEFGCKLGVNYIAASFVQSAEDIQSIRAILTQCDAHDVRIIAKIESRSGVDNIDDILFASDGIMVARGDLGVEIPIEEVPLVQKRLIHMCNMAGKPVITATQMLESMIQNPRPTRAEANDVANSILDGTDAIMLSGETAAGRYPAAAVRTMDRIARTVTITPHSIPAGGSGTVTSAVSHACCNIASDLGAKAIITPTKSGTTAAMVARHRPSCPIIACAINEACYHRMSLIWGVIPLMLPEISSTDELFERCVSDVEKAGLLKSGDIAVVTAGVPLSMAGTTNLIHVQIVGNVLLRGKGVGTRAAFGRARLANTPDFPSLFSDGDILVAHATDNHLLPLMKRAGALVVEDRDSLGHAAVVGLALDIPVLLSAENALSRIRDGMYITVDASTGFVYNGRMSSLPSVL